MKAVQHCYTASSRSTLSCRNVRKLQVCSHGCSVLHLDAVQVLWLFADVPLLMCGVPVLCRGRPKLYVAAWGGLADGASPEGVPFGGNGRHVLRCVGGHAATLPPDTYLTSLSRYAGHFEHSRRGWCMACMVYRLLWGWL